MSLVQLAKKKKTKLGAVTTLGRSRDNTLCILEGSASRFHAKIWLDNNIPCTSHMSTDVANDTTDIKDLDSAAGTFVNDKKIQVTPLKPGDVITIGETAKYEFCVKDHKKIFCLKENSHSNKRPEYPTSSSSLV